MPDIAEIVVRDFSNELTTMKIHTVDLTAANLAAQQTALATLVAAAEVVIRGEIAESRLKVTTPGTAILPTDPEAQIEMAWLVTYSDTQQFLDPGPDTVPNPGWGLLFTMSIPCADLSGTHLTTGSDFADLTDPDIAAFVTAFEALYRSPYSGTINVQSIRVHGVDN